MGANKSIRHSGDNLTGEGDGDDEQIYVNLDQLSNNVKSLYFIINSYSGHPFSRIKNAYIRIINCKNQKELVSFELSGGGDYTACLVGKLYRQQSTHSETPTWMFKAIGYRTQGRMYTDNILDMTKELAGRLKLGDQAQYKLKPRRELKSLTTKKGSTDNMTWIIVIFVVVLI